MTRFIEMYVTVGDFDSRNVCNGPMSIWIPPWTRLHIHSHVGSTGVTQHIYGEVLYHYNINTVDQPKLKPKRLYSAKYAFRSLKYSQRNCSVLSRWTDKILFASCVSKILTISSRRPTYRLTEGSYQLRVPGKSQ